MNIYLPYTYVIHHPLTNKSYYGVRYARKCSPNDLWVTYFTSSKHVKALIDQYGKESFVCEVRKIFNSREDAISWEQKVLRRLKVAENDKWLNVTYNGLYNHKGTHSEETRKKISEKVRGRTISEEQRAKVRATLLGRSRSSETISKIKATKAKNGYRPSEQQIISQSGTWKITLPNGDTETIVNLRTYCIDKGLSAGNMRLVSIGKRSHHKGYLCERLMVNPE